MTARKDYGCPSWCVVDREAHASDARHGFPFILHESDIVDDVGDVVRVSRRVEIENGQAGDLVVTVAAGTGSSHDLLFDNAANLHYRPADARTLALALLRAADRAEEWKEQDTDADDLGQRAAEDWRRLGIPLDATRQQARELGLTFRTQDFAAVRRYVNHRAELAQ